MLTKRKPLNLRIESTDRTIVGAGMHATVCLTCVIGTAAGALVISHENAKAFSMHTLSVFESAFVPIMVVCSPQHE